MGCRHYALAAALAVAATQSNAQSLIAFTDNAPFGATSAFLADTASNWAVQWTQTVATANVSLSALVLAQLQSTSIPASWYVTTAIGPGTTLADVVASGSYTPPVGNDCCDYNILPRTTLGTGLSFGAGTYYLVLDGPAGPFLNNAHWTGGGANSIALAPGFSIGSYYWSGAPAGFSPESAYSVYSGGAQFVFEMEAVRPVVPEPASWAMMIVGFLLAGTALRQRKVAVRFA